MRRSTCYLIFLSLGALCVGSTGLAAEPAGELSPVIARVLNEGKNNNIPPAFSSALGLNTNKPASGKVLISRLAVGDSS
jgi:hypothetical protein